MNKKRIRSFTAVASGNYEVGYGKPPKHSRFKKGQSGNPRGRPKRHQTPHALLQEALSAPITIREGEQMRTINQRTALFKALVAKAIKGDMRAASLVLKLMDDPKAAAHEEPRITKIVRQIVYPPKRE